MSNNFQKPPFPFPPFPPMPPIPHFPFMPNTDQNAEPENTEQQNGFPFPFPPVPHFPFMPGMKMQNEQQEGFQFGSFTVPYSALQWLMQIKATPKALEELQKFLDTLFAAYSKPKN